MDASVSEFGHIYCCKQGFQSKLNNRMTINVDLDETARYEMSHLDVHCMQSYLYRSAGKRGMKYQHFFSANCAFIMLNEICAGQKRADPDHRCAHAPGRHLFV